MDAFPGPEGIYRCDEIGHWSEIKLDIVRDYAAAYSRVLAAQKNPELYHVYVDAFAGTGVHFARTSARVVPGSPTNALYIKPRFREYFFIDINGQRVKQLERIAQRIPQVHVLQGDCNALLLAEVFPRIQYRQYRRGLCLLDPYGLHLDWEVIRTAGQMRSVEIFLNFPVLDMNRNVLWRNHEAVRPEQAERMTRFWGDESWKQAAYRVSRQTSLFGDVMEKTETGNVVEAFRQRLRSVAGFAYVPEPVPMRNSRGNIIYYLFFASQKPVAAEIVTHIFEKYRRLA